jgi:hypothetical protein
LKYLKMTFDSFVNVPSENTNNIENVNNESTNIEMAKASPIVNVEEPLAVKVSYGDELRRATLNGNAFVALRDLCAKLFELDPATTVLKYQDDDGDKITMSSDGELQDAIQAAKEKKILRVFVDVKGPTIPPQDPAQTEEVPVHGAFWGWRGRHAGAGYPMRGHARGHWAGGHGFPRGGPHGGHPFMHHGPGPHHGPHGHRGGFMPGHFTFAHAAPPVQTEQVPAGTQAEGAPTATYTIPRVFGHGTFTPAEHAHTHRPPFSPYARSCNESKDFRRQMKEQIRMMKQVALTEDDWAAIKDAKEQVRAHCKTDKKAWKAERKAEKAQWREGKKCEKKEKKCEKKWEKCGKDGKLAARHVADVTIPDNSELPADTPVTKTWRLRNAGLQAWPADSQLIFISRRGDNLNGPERVFVGSVEPNQEVDVSVTFITPSEPGRYIGYYRMASGAGAKFGQRVWVAFIIPNTTNVNMFVEAPSAPVDPTVPLLPTTPLSPSAPSSRLPQEPLQAPDAADDITMD